MRCRFERTSVSSATRRRRGRQFAALGRSVPHAQALLLYQLKLHPWAGRFKALRDYLMVDFDDSRPAVVDQVIGAAFIVPRPLWEAFGGLDEGYFLSSRKLT